jgi:tetratricopeptide (TPR) repeat protein
MIDVEDGSQRWAKSYPMELSTVFPVVTAMSRDVTSNLGPWSRDEVQTARRSIKPEARNEYMLGRYYWRKRDNNRTLKEAIDHFNAAISLEPNYAEAYAGLADCYLVGNVVSYPDLGLTTAEAMQRAERAAKDAVDLDEELAEAHTSLGYVYLKSRWDWQGAEREFKRAIELNPDYDQAYFGFSNLRAITGPQSEAIALSRKAKELDPFSPVAGLNFCRSYYYARRYEDASSCFDKLVEDNRAYTNGQYSRAFVYLKRGLNSEAIKVLEELYAKDKRSAAAALGYAYGVAGNKEGAQKVLAELENLSKQSNIPPQEFMLVYLGLGDDDHTFFWLNRAADEHFAPTAYIAVDPMYDRIRSDPRFTALVKRLNLPLQPPD